MLLNISVKTFNKAFGKITANMIAIYITLFN